MLRGLWKLVWVEIKVFLREPMGVIGTVFTPIAVFLILNQLSKQTAALELDTSSLEISSVPILIILLVALGNVLSLTAIISIYREGGILKRLKATPLQPQTILAAHVIVKLGLSAATLLLLLLAGKNFLADQPTANPFSFAAAMLLSMVSILSIGFIVASVVPTARFAQPAGSLLLYPMLALSGLFFPLDLLPPTLQIVTQLSPVTHAVSLLQGIWDGHSWSEHLVSVGALLANLGLCTTLAGKIFRWE